MTAMVSKALRHVTHAAGVNEKLPKTVEYFAESSVAAMPFFLQPSINASDREVNLSSSSLLCLDRGDFGWKV